jgi:SET domain-containing protein
MALRDIQAGEELRYDYGYELVGYEKRPCTCGAKQCCGYMVDAEFRGKIKPQWQ